MTEKRDGFINSNLSRDRGGERGSTASATINRLRSLGCGLTWEHAHNTVRLYVYPSASTVKHGETCACGGANGRVGREGTRGNAVERRVGGEDGGKRTLERGNTCRYELTISGRTGSVFRRPVIELVTYLPLACPRYRARCYTLRRWH